MKWLIHLYERYLKLYNFDSIMFLCTLDWTLFTNESSRGAVANVLDCGLKVSEFKLQFGLLLSLSDKYIYENYEPRSLL